MATLTRSAARIVAELVAIVVLLANAAVCGVISNPHDRYGSRIAWTAVFAAALAVWRWIALVRARAVGSAAKVFR
ncbi:MAG: hypothetical protein ACLPX7_16350 [Xanthobacteraceae bacterium]